MIGFTADYAGGELRVEPDEIEDAGWFEADDLPVVPPRISIARAMIDAFVAQRDRDHRRTTAGQRDQDVPPSGELEYPEGRTT
jgi:NADH pyrophosphatase NudC (nudix superfamily)